MARKSVVLLAVVWSVVAPAGAACPLADPADCIYVNDDCPTPPGTGAELDPFCTIQDAYDAFATPGTLITILVMPGAYNECVVAGDFDANGDLSLAYLDKPVHLIADAWLEAGMPDPDPLDLSIFEAVVDDTTITGFGTCDGLGNSRAATVSIAGTDAKLEGFAITAGGASGVNARGGVDVSHNLVFNNEGELGGGISLRTETCALSAGDVDPIVISSSVTSNVVRNNLADDFTEFGAGDGGGIFVLADGFELSFLCDSVGGQSDVTVANNFLVQNTARNLFIDFLLNDTFAAGGGLTVETLTGGEFPPVTPLEDWQARVRIAGNTVADNTVDAGDGFAFGAGISTVSAGTGMETVEIENNTVGPNNVATSTAQLAFGGGISASTVPVFFCDHEVTIDGNSIFENTADIGGGLDMFVFAGDLQANQRQVVTASSNSIENNMSRSQGGGLNVEFNSQRSLDVNDADLFTPPPIDFLADEISVTMKNNTLRNNTSEGVGAGAVLRPDANSDPDSTTICAGNERPAAALIDFVGNLVEGNTAEGTIVSGSGDHPGGPGCSDPICETVICDLDPFCCDVEWDALCFEAAAGNPACDCDTSDCCGAILVGSGVLVFAAAKGESLASVRIVTSTIVDNMIGPPANGFVGGVEVTATTTPDCPNNFLGMADMTVDSSIVAGNDGAGIGGPVPDPNLDVVVKYCDVFANMEANYAESLFPDDLTGQFGNISEDPLFLDPGLGDYHITASSPVVDAGNPSPVDFPPEDFEGDPRIFDGDGDGTPRVDMGYDELVCLDDGDGDGFSECQGDCDDDDPTVNPQTPEICDGIDNDCNGLIDDACSPFEIALNLSRELLWPPNHHMIDIVADVVVTSSPGEPLSVVLTSITSNEADNAPGPGDGNTDNDIQGAETETADFEFQLRAERAGTGTGRIYTVIYTVTDSDGNKTSAAGFVVVPHDQGGVVDPVEILIEKNDSGTVVSWPPVPDAQSYDVIRGRLGNLEATEVVISLGMVLCVEDDSPDENTLGWEDPEIPELGETLFYLVEYYDGVSSSYGTESAGKPRAPGWGDCE